MQTLHRMVGEDVETIQELLKGRNQTLATAESITAGLLSFSLTMYAGSSDYFKQGWVLYQEESKRKDFHMPPRVNVYSPECAQWLAEEARLKAGTTYGLGITGLAEPDNGVVWFAASHADGLYPCHRTFTGDRNSIRLQAASAVLHEFANLILTK